MKLLLACIEFLTVSDYKGNVKLQGPSTKPSFVIKLSKLFFPPQREATSKNFGFPTWCCEGLPPRQIVLGLFSFLGQSPALTECFRQKRVRISEFYPLCMAYLLCCSSLVTDICSLDCSVTAVNYWLQSIINYQLLEKEWVFWLCAGISYWPYHCIQFAGIFCIMLLCIYISGGFKLSLFLFKVKYSHQKLMYQNQCKR